MNVGLANCDGFFFSFLIPFVRFFFSVVGVLFDKSSLRWSLTVYVKNQKWVINITQHTLTYLYILILLTRSCDLSCSVVSFLLSCTTCLPFLNVCIVADDVDDLVFFEDHILLLGFEEKELVFKSFSGFSPFDAQAFFLKSPTKTGLFLRSF